MRSSSEFLVYVNRQTIRSEHILYKWFRPNLFVTQAQVVFCYNRLLCSNTRLKKVNGILPDSKYTL